MKLQHLNVKIFTDEKSRQIPLDTYIPIFHRWIQNKVTEEMLIDVADYAHVPEGPGVLLIGHHANISMDNIGNRLGLLYNRKVADEGSNEELIRKTLKAAITHALRLQEEKEVKGLLNFSGSGLEFIANDRLLAPNTPQNVEALQKELSPLLDKVYSAGNYSVQGPQESRDRLGLIIEAKNKISVQDLSEKL